MKKRIVSLLLSLVLLVGILPTAAWADEGLPDMEETSIAEASEMPDTEDPVPGEMEPPPEDLPFPAAEPAEEAEITEDPAAEAPEEPELTEPELEGEPAAELEELLTELEERLEEELEDSEAEELSPFGPDYTAYPAEKVTGSKLLFASAPSSCTVYINISGMNGYTNTATGSLMSRHFIDDGGLVKACFCIEPSASAVNNENYAINGALSNQTLKDVLQIAYEWGYWDDTASFSAENIAATQVAVWWAMGYSSASCNSSSVNSKATSLYNAALADAGCGGGDLYAYRCTTNSAHQLLASYYPERAVTTEYGSVKLKKTSANPEITDGNDCYSLALATYGIYSSQKNAANNVNRLGVLATNSAGESNTVSGIEAGYVYFVKEISAPKGYALDPTVYPIYVEANKTTTLTVKDVPQSDPVGVLLRKVDKETGEPVAQGNASLAGAEYTYRFYGGTYSSAAEAEASGTPTRTWVFKTNENGVCRLDNPALFVSGDDLYYTDKNKVTLPIGWLLIQETKAPEGYLIDDTVYAVQITADGAQAEIVNSYNEPIVSEKVQEGNIQITKRTVTGLDKHTIPEDGAVFQIYLKSAGDYEAAAETDRAEITTDDDGVAMAEGLPVGRYIVHQVSGHPGTTLCGDFEVEISENGKTYSYTIDNEKFYAAVQVVKRDSRTGEPIPVAGIGFQFRDPAGNLITYNGTDTWYSDADGIVRLPMELEYGTGYQAIEVAAPAGYVLDSTPISFDVTAENAGSALLVTVTAENTPTTLQVSKVDPYGNAVPGAQLQLLDQEGNEVASWTTDGTPKTIYELHIRETYTLHEKAAPAGWLLAEDITVTIQDTTEVQSVSMEDEELPEIQTTALVDGLHEAMAAEDITLTDTVTYTKLVPGREYTVTGTLMDQATGETVKDAEGNPITASATFTPTESDGSVDVIFTFSAVRLAGHTTVVFESLYKDGHLLCAHADLNDEEQTVHFPEIQTTASFTDGKKAATAGDKMTLTDTVTYTNLIPGFAYTIRGVLMDKTTGKPFEQDRDGTQVTAEATFTPTEANGTVEVTFEFKGSGITSKTDLVAFEELYIDKTLLAAHADLDDEGQTVTVKPPYIGDEDDWGYITINGKYPGSPTTADYFRPALWLSLLLTALTGVILVCVNRKKKGGKRAEKICSVFLLLGLIAACVPTTAMADVETSVYGQTATQVQTIRSRTGEIEGVDIPETITLDGHEYQLQSVEPEIVGDYHAPVTAAQTVTLHRESTEEEYPMVITKEVDGFICDLVATQEPAVEWRSITKEYDTDQVPETLEEGVTYYLQGVAVDESKAAQTYFEVPAEFATSNTQRLTYALGEKTVTLPSMDAPVWTGYEQDVKTYLGLPGEYRVTGGCWNGEFVYSSEIGGYVRKAIYSGYRDMPMRIATYMQDECSVSVTYVDMDYPDGYYTVRITATYQQSTSVLATVLKVGGAIAVAAVAAAGIIVFLKRKREDEEEQQTI